MIVHPKFGVTGIERAGRNEIHPGCIRNKRVPSIALWGRLRSNNSRNGRQAIASRRAVKLNGLTASIISTCCNSIATKGEVV